MTMILGPFCLHSIPIKEQDSNCWRYWIPLSAQLIITALSFCLADGFIHRTQATVSTVNSTVKAQHIY